MLWDLWKEVFCKYRDEWLERRKSLGWKKNLSLLMFVLAFIVLIIIIFAIFADPARARIF